MGLGKFQETATSRIQCNVGSRQTLPTR